MTIIGFDVSKHELVGVRINKSAAIKERFVIKNNQQAIQDFLRQMHLRYPKFTIASEATAEYHRALALECLKMNIPLRLLNPIITKQFTRATVRKKKTDLTDALIIAKCVLQGEGTVVTSQSLNSLKIINRTSYKLYELYSALERIHRRFYETFPEQTEIINELQGLKDNLEKNIKKIRQRVQAKVDALLLDLLCSISGVGPILASTFVTEIGDIEHFSNQKSLVAYAGLDPKVKQSGTRLKRNTHLTKRGSPHLRRAAYIAASVAQRCDPELKAYYQKKRGEGKRYREATIANARHILNRVYAVWKRRTPYLKYPTLSKISTEHLT